MKHTLQILLALGSSAVMLALQSVECIRH